MSDFLSCCLPTWSQVYLKSLQNVSQEWKDQKKSFSGGFMASVLVNMSDHFVLEVSKGFKLWILCILILAYYKSSEKSFVFITRVTVINHCVLCKSKSDIKLWYIYEFYWIFDFSFVYLYLRLMSVTWKIGI